MIDLGPPPLWLPPEPAILRAARIEDRPLPLQAVLPGLAPVLTRKPASGTTLSFFNSATSNAATITAPASIVAGDVMVLADRAKASSLPTSVTPAGWTSITAVNNGTDTRVNLSYKKAAGTEGGTSITGMNVSGGGSAMQKVMLVFRGPVSTITPSAMFDSGFTDGDPSAQVVTSGSGASPLVVIGSISVSTSSVVPTYTMTPAEDGSAATADRLKVAYKIYNSSPADVTVDGADNGTANHVVGFYLQVN